LKNVFKNLSLLFASGSLGGLTNSITVWIFGTLGITAALGVKLTPALTKTWLYPRIVWGGLWRFLFLLPFLRQSLFFRGLLYSLGPKIVQLFIIFPIQAGKGLMGIHLGIMTLIFVLFFNAVWGICTALWIKFTKESPGNVIET